MRWILALLALISAFGTSADAQRSGGHDLFVLNEQKRPDIDYNDQGVNNPGAKTLRSAALNVGENTLIMIVDGQSQMTSVGPSAYTPVNGSKIDNFSIYDGANYAAVDPMLGATYQSSLGPGSIAMRVADLYITNGQFARVIIVPIAVGGTTIAMHAAGGALYDRACVAMRRLAGRGIVPGTANTAFAYIWGQGESDSGTSQASYQASFQQIVARLKNCPSVATQFSGRIFVNVETWLSGVTNATIQAAQAAVVDNVSIFAGFNMDTLNATHRQADNTHLNTNSISVGQGAAATGLYNAMHATGAPF